MRAHQVATLAVAVVFLLLPGCQSPGPVSAQRARAQQFDPYPETKVAPEIAGGRPREYQDPPAETARARWFPWNWRRR